MVTRTAVVQDWFLETNSGIVVATPAGTLSRYFFGIDYSPRDLKFALIESSREKIGTLPYQVSEDGTVEPLDEPGIGIEVDEDFLRAHPFIEGKAFV